LDRLTSSYQSSVRAAGGTVGSKAFKIESRKNKATQEDSDLDSGEEDGVTTVQGKNKRRTHDNEAVSEAGDESPELSGSAGENKSSGSDGIDKTSALPDAAVPLGLIAKLSLSNGSGKNRGGKSDDDDDLVSF
jgi:hypothetical protein